MFKENVSLQGRFKFNVYKSDGSLRYSSDYIDNFITSTGLSYPSNFAFADCFRFISIGTGTGKNTILSSVNNGWGTTGLDHVLSSYSYIGSQTPDRVSLYESEACGFREQDNKVILTRGWRIPAGDGYFDQNYNLNEFMLSPGRPYVYGTDGNKVCSSNDYSNLGQPGQDGSSIASYYTQPSICSADKAFARVVKSINVNQDDFLIVSYDLNITFNTGIQDIILSIINGSAGNPNWSGTFYGKSNLIHHGIKLINDGIHSSYVQRTQIPAYSFATEYGESFTSLWGCPLEPSTTGTNFIAYLSTDDIQFVVNRISGGASDTISPPAYGVMDWHSYPTLEVVNGFSDNLINVRQDGTKSIYPDNTDYRNNTSADAMGFDVSFSKSSRFQHTAMNGQIINSRSRTGAYSVQFWTRTSDEIAFIGKPVRAMVLGYIDDSDTSKVYPFFDAVFSDKNHNYIQATPYTYPLPNETSNPATGYFYMENGGQLTVSFKMSWSSPCDSINVNGC